MRRMHNTTKTLTALIFALLLGGYGMAAARDAGTQDEMPKGSDAMMEHCPMMQEGVMQDGAVMEEMMANCPMMKGRDAEVQASHAPAEMMDDVQEVKITVGPMGYKPKKITLQAGVPVKLIFTRTAEGGCTGQVQSPDLGIKKTDLPLNKPVTFEITPEKDGTFTFACGMNMTKGTIVVES